MSRAECRLGIYHPYTGELLEALEEDVFETQTEMFGDEMLALTEEETVQQSGDNGLKQLVEVVQKDLGV